MIDAEGKKKSSRARKLSQHWRAPRIREAHFDDYHQIANLESRFGLTTKPYQEWVHLWEDNPLYQEVRADWPIGWVLEDGQGKVVGSMGNIPLPYELDGRRILAASGRHWVAEKEYRSASILLLDRLITQPLIDLYVNTTVSAASVPSVIALGCSPMPVGIWDEVAYWITNYFGCFTTLFAGKNPLGFSLWRGSWRHLKATGALLARVSRQRNSKHSLTRNAADFRADVTACADFDDRFDGFWDELKRTNSQRLLALRSLQFLRWHFKYAMLANRLWIATVTDGPRLIAYGIFRKTRNAATGLKQVKLVDYQALDDSPACLGVLVSWALNRCRSEGIQVFEHTGRWLETGEFFQTEAPYRRKLPSWQYFYRVNNPALKTVLSKERVWAPFLFDGDATL